MSLLLDALKKAAEQKAENSRETVAEQGSSGDTVLRDQSTTKIASESEEDNQYASFDDSGFDYSEIDLEIEEGEGPVVIADEAIVGNFDEDKTLIFTDDDVTAFLGDDTPLKPKLEAETGSPQNDTEADMTDSQSGELDASVDEELSISLFNEDDTLTTAEAAGQASDALAEEIELQLAPLNDITKSLNLPAVPDKGNIEAEIGRSSVVDGVNTAPANEHRTETELDTSTRTFAPDNYDRTLQRPGSGDVSNLFAGAKSDSGIVMTPEYAKKMFRSKTSAQRMHNVKIYAGTALAILVVILVIGILQLEQDTDSIESRLRYLKRDPMPGLIKNTATSEKFTDVFAVTPGSEVDATTLELVKNAESLVDAEEVVAVKLGTDEEASVEDAIERQVDSKIAAVAEVQTLSSENEPGLTKINTQSAIAKDNSTATSNTIKISSSSKISEKDRLLREAYEAYQRGDDKQALAKYNTALDLDPGNRNALLARAAIYVQNDRIPEAIRDYRTLLIANPKDSLAMSSMIAVANFSPEQSETQLKLMIRDEPDSPYLSFALGNIFGAQNRWQEAQGQYFAALQNNPNDPNYAYNLAVSLEHIARPKVAIAYYEKALNNYNNGLATFNRDIVDARLEILKQL